MVNHQVDVLLVSPFEADHTAFEQIFRETCWTLRHARSLGEALTEIERAPASVIVSETRLPDGDWRDLLERTRELPRPPVLIVASEQLDAALWATVLNLGAYDFVPKPFDRAEVLRLVGLAWLFWNDQGGWMAPAATLPQPERLRLSYAA
jgi:DNA-binding NtrC family response regulator